MRIVSWCLIGSICFGPLAAGPDVSGQDPELRLVEIDSWTLPDSFDLSGLSTSEEGKIVLWSTSEDYLVILDEQLDLNRHVPIPSYGSLQFVSLRDDRGIELVFEGSTDVHRISMDGGYYLGQSEGVRIEGSSVAVGRTAEDWIFLSRALDGSLLLHRRNVNTGRERAKPGWEDLTTDGYTISTQGHEFIVTQRAAPFRVRAFTVGLGEPLVFQPDLPVDLLGQARPDTTSVPTNFVSLPTLRLEVGYVQTLADLASDRRILVQYDHAGRTVRTVHLKVPLGLVSSLPGQGIVLAARRTNRLEVVKYAVRD